MQCWPIPQRQNDDATNAENKLPIKTADKRDVFLAAAAKNCGMP